MNLSKISYFLKAAEYSNFTKAAAECYIAQTTMSKYIAELESELGFSLFQRNHKNVVLTREGRTFYEGVKSIYKDYQDLVSEIQKKNKCEIHLGMMTREYADFPLLSAFERKNEDCCLYFAYGEESELIKAFNEARLDCLICSEYLELEGLRKTDITRVCLNKSRESLIYSRQLAEKYGSVKEVILHTPMITKSSSSSFHQLCERRLKNLTGAAFQTVRVVKEFHQQILMVNMSKGFAIVPSGKAYAGENVMTFSLSEDFDEITSIIFNSETENPTFRELVKFIEENS